MKKTPKQYRNKDHTKLLIIKYQFSKDAGTVTTLYELLHHAGISSYDYPYLKKILQEMADSGWIRIIKSGSLGSEKLNYLLTTRGRKLFMAVKDFEKNHPLLDLDIFHGI